MTKTTPGFIVTATFHVLSKGRDDVAMEQCAKDSVNLKRRLSDLTISGAVLAAGPPKSTYRDKLKDPNEGIAEPLENPLNVGADTDIEEGEDQ